MTRLLFAVARGARIERPIAHDIWIGTTQIWTAGNEDVRRIHPDDEHLQYGPISTALREQAQDPFAYTLSVNATHGVWEAKTIDWMAYVGCGDRFHLSLFLLILAEALADEGL